MLIIVKPSPIAIATVVGSMFPVSGSDEGVGIAVGVRDGPVVGVAVNNKVGVGVVGLGVADGVPVVVGRGVVAAATVGVGSPPPTPLTVIVVLVALLQSIISVTRWFRLRVILESVVFPSSHCTLAIVAPLVTP